LQEEKNKHISLDICNKIVFDKGSSDTAGPHVIEDPFGRILYIARITSRVFHYFANEDEDLVLQSKIVSTKIGTSIHSIESLHHQA
jgi:hypothetical protein